MDNSTVSECVRTVANEVKSEKCYEADESRPTEIDLQTEKCDGMPENVEKSSCDVTPKDEDSASVSTATTSGVQTPSSQLTSEAASDRSKSKNAPGFAFTIDFNEGKAVDNKKYKEIVERFQSRQQQQRHRRGVSLSKLDDTHKSTNSLNYSGLSPTVDDASASQKPPVKQPKPKAESAEAAPPGDAVTETAVPLRAKLRRKPQSSQMQKVESAKDSTKRHSWSPRSSSNFELPVPPPPPTPSQPPQPPRCNQSTIHKSPGFQPKSTALQRAFETVAEAGAPKKPISSRKKVLSAVVTEPLEYVRPLDDDASVGAVSDTGTYTLDGDNYTEEEKERMSIDRVAKQNERKYLHLRAQQQIDSTMNHPKSPASSKPAAEQYTAKLSYLEKIRSRVKSIGDRKFPALHKNSKQTVCSPKANADPKCDDSADRGMFTSITACGVLNKNGSPEVSIASNRKNSLTKLQIDSSEYIQPKYNIDEKLLNSYTDYEKAKQNIYQLNIFSTSSSYVPDDSEAPDYDELSLDEERASLSIRTAPTKNDWIQEWARNARRRNNMMAASTKSAALHSKVDAIKSDARMTQSCEYASYGTNGAHNGHATAADSDAMDPHAGDAKYFARRSNIRNSQRTNVSGYSDVQRTSTSVLRPPVSPTKIPSPVHTQLRARSSSVNSSFRNGSAASGPDTRDTEIYLEKTAAAISSLQRMRQKNNSPQGPLSPMRKGSFGEFAIRNTYEEPINLRPLHLHKRNLSLDVRKVKNVDAEQLAYETQANEHHRPRHTRHNSYETKAIQLNSPQRTNIDQTLRDQKALFTEQQRLLNKYLEDERNMASRRSSVGSGVANAHATTGSPIRRSTSFCNKKLPGSQGAAGKSATPLAKKKTLQRVGGNALQKSASSSSFKKALQTHRLHDYDENAKFYVNDEDDLHPNDDDYNLIYSSDDSDIANASNSNSSHRYESDAVASTEPPISRTRYNKAFLMRMEQNKQIAAAGSTSNVNHGRGLVACPNTPELPRATFKARGSFRDRTSMPRDSSLSRMKQDIPNLQTTKKALTQTPARESGGRQRIQPKYLDISKYKPVQGQNFLKRDESKSTLINRNELRKSPSAIGLSKGDATRMSGRVKSAGAKPSPANSKGSIHTLRTEKGTLNGLHLRLLSPESKSREAELAMWKRRATYDPMKAAAEGRKKQEETKKQKPSRERYILHRTSDFFYTFSEQHSYRFIPFFFYVFFRTDFFHFYCLFFFRLLSLLRLRDIDLQ